MANYNSSAAYDLNTFDVRSTREVKQNVVHVVEKQRAKAARRSAAKILAGFVLFVSVFAANVYGYARMTEATAQVGRLESQLEELQNEGKILNVQYDEMVDLRTVEQMAIYNYGMNKLTPNQMEYVTVRNADKVELLADKSFHIKDIIPTTFRRLSALLEYFS